MVGFPLLLIPIAIYNIVAWLMPSVSLTDALGRVMLPSGAEWPITLSDVLLTIGILLLLLEIAKGARPGSKYLTDHLLSLVLFGGSAAEFLLWSKFGTSTFFLLSLMAMVDFLGGIVLRAGRRPLASHATAARAGPRAEDPVPGPRLEPAPAATARPVPPAAPVAEPVLSDHPAPKAGPEPPQPMAEPSPGLQAGAAAAGSSETPER
ncbi:MAG: hypothetical protein JOZ74_06175 [Bradyrhizobium sp.]|nr:hypothetical protein [Bradyrhizobium sp.]